MHPIIAEQLVSSYQDDLARARRHTFVEPGSRRSRNIFRSRRSHTRQDTTTA